MPASDALEVLEEHELLTVIAMKDSHSETMILEPCERAPLRIDGTRP